MRLLIMLVELVLALPWWGSALVVAGVVALLAAPAVWLALKIRSITQEALTQVAGPLVDAEATVHSIEPAERPTTNSPFDVEDDFDDDFDDDADVEFDAEEDSPFGGPEAWQTEGDFYWLDVTITPSEQSAQWHASVLTLVPADWRGAIGECCETIGPLHSIELASPAGFRPLTDGEDVLTGRQRVRLLMAAPPDRSHVKFAYYGATFGDFKLPARKLVGAR